MDFELFRPLLTDASVHDSQTVDDLTNEADAGRELCTDSAYTGKPIEDILAGKGIVSRINEKGCRNKPHRKDAPKIRQGTQKGRKQGGNYRESAQSKEKSRGTREKSILIRYYGLSGPELAAC
ncbi:MAG: transposase, partial [Bacteroidales bacterium]